MIKDKKETLAKRFITLQPFLVVLLLLSATVFGSIERVDKASAQSDSAEVFLVKPYLQLGDQPKLQKSESLELVWFSLSAGESSDWKVQVDCAREDKWGKNYKVKAVHRMGLAAGQPFFRYTAEISGLKPGEPFSYRVLKGEKQVFQADAVARKGFNQPFKFAVVGDIGAGSSGQKAVANQMFKQRPDFLLIPGDIVYNRGLVSEYLTRFFPIMNSDVSSPTSGAPLLRSTTTIATIGNHDIALSNAWEGTDFTKFPDALGYYLFWSSPLNGPNKVVNSKNTTRIVGKAENQINFVKAAGKRFPTMANYSFDYGNSHWIVLDGNPYMDWTDQKIREWVDNDLARAKSATWKFAAFHQPGFSVDEAHAGEQRMRLLCDIFEKHKVDVVFSGHAHCYQRTLPLKFKPDLSKLQGTVHDAVVGQFSCDKVFDGKSKTVPNGVIYIVTGGGGAGLYRQRNEPQAEHLEKYVYSHGFTMCDVNDKTLRISQVSPDGKVQDQFNLTKATLKLPQ